MVRLQVSIILFIKQVSLDNKCIEALKSISNDTNKKCDICESGIQQVNKDIFMFAYSKI